MADGTHWFDDAGARIDARCKCPEPVVPSTREKSSLEQGVDAKFAKLEPNGAHLSAGCRQSQQYKLKEINIMPKLQLHGSALALILIAGCGPSSAQTTQPNLSQPKADQRAEAHRSNGPDTPTFQER